jgi:hypothetical protein
MIMKRNKIICFSSKDIGLTKKHPFGCFFMNIFFEWLFKLIGINVGQKEFFLIFEMDFIAK